MKEIISYVGEYCCVNRDFNYVVCYPVNEYVNVTLSDERLRLLFSVYADLLRKQKIDDKRSEQ